MKEYIKEAAQGGELALYKVLTELAPAYNDQFSVLKLPYALDIDAASQRLTLPYYDGEDFNSRWNESDGGSNINIELADKVPLLLEDLGKISIRAVLENSAVENIPKLVFEHESAIEYFGSLAGVFKDAGLISNENNSRIQKILSFRQTSSQIVNNGDFYPRNLIEVPDGKLVLIDWETWNDHSPFFVVDHPENVAAVMYVHMWGNPKWQSTYRKQLMDRFGFEEASLTKGIVMKSLQLANMWFDKGEAFKDSLVVHQIKILREVLS